MHLQITTCSVDGCGLKIIARKWCCGHYARWRDHRDLRTEIPIRVRNRPLAERFWEKVDKSGECWIWTDYVNPSGYGQFGKVLAHRLSWELANGRPLGPGKWALHHCDNRPCVRPEHLYEGTAKDNMRDASQRGRLWSPRGEDHPSSKLTTSDVMEIRELAGKATYRSVATQFGISQALVYAIWKRQRWTHI